MGVEDLPSSFVAGWRSTPSQHIPLRNATATADACAAAIEAAVYAAQSSVALNLDFAPGQDLTVQCDGFEGARVIAGGR
jgi:hypothetical protein